MTFRWCIVSCLIIVPVEALAIPLCGFVELRDRNVAAIDEDDNDIFVDKYYVSLFNPNPDPVGSIQLSLPGRFVQGDDTFRNTTEFDRFREFQFADTFFVIPQSISIFDVLSAEITDSAGLLQGSYTLLGRGVLVPARASAVVAVLSVEAGATDAFDQGNFEILG